MTEGCVGSLQNAAEALDRSGFVGRPSGEWHHGWQYYASSFLEHKFRETVVIAQSSAANQAHLRSHSGPGASAVLCGAPTRPEFTLGGVQNSCARAFAVATADHKVPLRVWGVSRPLGPPQGSLSKVREVAFASGGARKNFGPNLSRGRGRGANQCDVEGHEHHCVGS